MLRVGFLRLRLARDFASFRRVSLPTNTMPKRKAETDASLAASEAGATAKRGRKESEGECASCRRGALSMRQEDGDATPPSF